MVECMEEGTEKRKEARSGRLPAVRMTKRPMPMKMMPMFSMLEYASMALRSCSLRA